MELRLLDWTRSVIVLVPLVLVPHVDKLHSILLCEFIPQTPIPFTG
jgi:hypothetical protein